MSRPFSEVLFSTLFLRHVGLDNKISKSLLFIFLLDETEMAQNKNGSENFKRQSRKTKLEDWHEPSNKSEITGFYMERIANLLWVCLSFLSHISAIVHFVVDGVAKLVFVSGSVEADDSPAPTLWSSLLSASLPPHFLLGNSL